MFQKSAHFLKYNGKIFRNQPPAMTDCCEQANFMGMFHEYGILDTTSRKFSQKMRILLKILQNLTLLQPPVMIAKGKISFATMTHGCKAIIINKVWSLLKIRINQYFFFTKKFLISHFSRQIPRIQNLMKGLLQIIG